jgi:hypothetical protein
MNVLGHAQANPENVVLLLVELLLAFRDQTMKLAR